MNGAEVQRRILEQDVRLSQSRAWDRLRDFYEGAGVAAWSGGTVPWRITNNAFLATACARVVFAHLQDLAATASVSGLDSGRPVNILDLGAGSGRFGFLFLRALLPMLEAASGDLPPVRYVLTDLAERNLQFWMRHPKLAPLVASGALDFAVFDVHADDCLALRVSGETISPGAGGNPLVAIANYAFDVLPQDAYRRVGTTLCERRLTLVDPGGEDAPGALPPLDRAEFHYRDAPADCTTYEDARFNEVLSHCLARHGEAPFLFPVGALRCLRTVARIGGGRLLLLASDLEAGFGSVAGEAAAPTVPRRYGGSFCLPIDFEALARWTESAGGFSMHAPARQADLHSAAFVLGGPVNAFRGTRAAFEREIAAFGPCDFHVLDEGFRRGGKVHDLSGALAFVRLSGFEPWTLHALADGILDGLADVPDGLKAIASETLARVAGNDYPVGDGCDVPFEIGRAYWRLGRNEEAIASYRESLDSHGDHPVTHYNMGLCHHAAGRADEALRCFARCLELDGSYAPAREWMARAEAGRGEPAGGRMSDG